MDKKAVEAVMSRFAFMCEYCAESSRKCAAKAEKNFMQFSVESVIRNEFVDAAYKLIGHYKFVSGMYTVMLELYTEGALPREEGLRVHKLYSDFFTAYSEASSRVDNAYDKKTDELVLARREKEGGTDSD